MATEYRGLDRKWVFYVKATVVATNKRTDMFVVDCEGSLLLIDPCGADAELGDELSIVFSQKPRKNSVLITNETQGVVMTGALIQGAFQSLESARQFLASQR